MKITELNYETLTAHQLEEWVEFIEWEKLPPHLITDKIVKQFGYLISKRKELLRRVAWAEWFIKLELGKIKDIELINN